MKTCCRCRVPKPLTDFSTDKYRPDGLHARCRECNAAYYRSTIAPRNLERPKPKPVVQPKPIPAPDKLESFKRQQAAPFPDHLIQRIPTPPPRFQVDPPRFGFSALGIGRYYP